MSEGTGAGGGVRERPGRTRRSDAFGGRDASRPKSAGSQFVLLGWRRARPTAAAEGETHLCRTRRRTRGTPSISRSIRSSLRTPWCLGRRRRGPRKCAREARDAAFRGEQHAKRNNCNAFWHLPRVWVVGREPRNAPRLDAREKNGGISAGYGKFNEFQQAKIGVEIGPQLRFLAELADRKDGAVRELKKLVANRAATEDSVIPRGTPVGPGFLPRRSAR